LYFPQALGSPLGKIAFETFEGKRGVKLPAGERRFITGEPRCGELLGAQQWKLSFGGPSERFGERSSSRRIRCAKKGIGVEEVKGRGGKGKMGPEAVGPGRNSCLSLEGVVKGVGPQGINKVA